MHYVNERECLCPHLFLSAPLSPHISGQPHPDPATTGFLVCCVFLLWFFFSFISIYAFSLPTILCPLSSTFPALVFPDPVIRFLNPALGFLDPTFGSSGPALASLPTRWVPGFYMEDALQFFQLFRLIPGLKFSGNDRHSPKDPSLRFCPSRELRSSLPMHV